MKFMSPNKKLLSLYAVLGPFFTPKGIITSSHCPSEVLKASLYSSPF